MNTYLIQFYTTRKGNGYAVVNACSPALAQSILTSQGSFIELEYNIISIKEVPYICAEDYTIIQEGVTTHGYSAYDYALKHGFQGSEEEWYNSLSLPAKDAQIAAEKALKEFAIATYDIMNTKTIVDDAISTFTEKYQPEKLTWKQYKSIENKELKIYLTTDTKDNVLRFYIGDTLIAAIADDGKHIIGLPYTLPAIV